MSDRESFPHRREAELLHQLRSSLARVQAEAEMLELDGVSVDPLVDAVSQALTRLAALEGLLCGSTAGSTGVRAMVIDDDARLAELTAERLSKRGISATHFTDLGPAAMSSHGGTLVIDYGVLLRASDRERSFLQGQSFVVVSGENSADAMRLAITLGAADYFVKPIRIGDLAARLAMMQEGRR